LGTSAASRGIAAGKNKVTVKSGNICANTAPGVKKKKIENRMVKRIQRGGCVQELGQRTANHLFWSVAYGLNVGGKCVSGLSLAPKKSVAHGGGILAGELLARTKMEKGGHSQCHGWHENTCILLWR